MGLIEPHKANTTLVFPAAIPTHSFLSELTELEESGSSSLGRFL